MSAAGAAAPAARRALEALARAGSGAGGAGTTWLREAQTAQLLRAWAVLGACRNRAFVRAAPSLLAVGQRTLGPRAIRAAVKPTFFDHFCGGESERDLGPLLAALRARGVGGILDYAAEMDIAGDDDAGGAASDYATADAAVARVYDYESEAACDRNKDIFLQAVRTVRNTSPRGFAAIKITALGNPRLLERAATALTEVRGLFHAFDPDGNGVISEAEFNAVYRSIFTEEAPARMNQIFGSLDRDRDGTVDYLEWANNVKLEDMKAIASRCLETGTFARSALTEEEVALFRATKRRLYEVAAEASRLGVRLMVDAEHTYFQPAIDSIVLGLQREFNRTRPVIFNTYQTYLTDSEARLEDDMRRARKEGWKFAAKLVRGAYLVLERERAGRLGVASPIHETFEATESNFHRCISAVLREVAGRDAAVMVASHNYASVRHTLREMDALGISGADNAFAGVSFGQLLGMSDNLTYTLGEHGLDAFKYVPYGPLEEVLPYLVRRAQENSELLSNSVKDLAGIQRELARRAARPFSGGRGKPVAVATS